jgi:hypothetical protein
MRALLVFAMVVLFWASNAGADCKTDCEQDYKTATEECQTTYNVTNDADQLQNCLDQAKADYEPCLEECKDEWDDDSER